MHMGVMINQSVSDRNLRTLENSLSVGSGESDESRRLAENTDSIRPSRSHDHEYHALVAHSGEDRE
jgi:hypothetical protein